MTDFTAGKISHGGDDWLIARYDAPDPVALSAALQAAASRLRDEGDWLDIVPGLAELCVRFDPLCENPNDALARFRTIAGMIRPADVCGDKVTDIPVCYGGDYGPDLEVSADRLGLSPDELIALHSGESFLVQMMGFAPGFAYCGQTPAALAIDRLPEPRRRVEAGSIGIAGRQTCLYSLAGPGGWPLIGRTPLTLFDPGRDEPFLLKAGQQVRFRAIDEAEFARLAEAG
ncbi:5-oxoprolinase subunit PxpB [Aquisalinus flavus]|uniref:Allophanate hydrolase n=1 Tax=Aquisalinus flavus TaxID=1526572 RepID=A0A8J2V401_9PROT|nr:5-oxoprolinase subunit PxpB [Aquisalinus flavus]MBD0425261.1 5-oxoprolinase subunit PxpB [Aquisalinus flavus]UNE49084.1 5-oxoprolinase subunit PxpB [Aquisalinus flavus]GGD17473.1 allophanate hydrolase [Aquisalinus flavus]